MARRIDRRGFLKESSSAALGATAVSLLGPVRAVAASQNAFRSAWPQNAERPWAGPDYWTDPLEDWRIREGRLECVRAGGDHNVVAIMRVLVEGLSGRVLAANVLDRHDVAVRGKPARGLESRGLYLRGLLVVLGAHQDDRDGISDDRPVDVGVARESPEPSGL